MCLVGGVPAIDGDYLHRASDALSDHDVCLGPAEDGDYGLVGVSGQVPDMFRNIRWSTSDVLADSCRHLNRQRINYALLSLIWDLDRPEDLARYQQQNPVIPASA